MVTRILLEGLSRAGNTTPRSPSLGMSRKQREQLFHNERFAQAEDPRAHLDKWYTSVQDGRWRQDELVLDCSPGKDVLEYGCADGTLSLDELCLTGTCRSLTGIDISDVAIFQAHNRVRRLGRDNARFFVMDAEDTDFPDNSFDVVFGRGILHHLDLDKCLSEISRILRPMGVAVFLEPMGHNPVAKLFRRATPDLRTADEHPILMSDFTRAREHFARVDTLFYGLLATASVLFDESCSGVLYRLGKTIDNVILRLPLIRRFAWQCLIVCYK